MATEYWPERTLNPIRSISFDLLSSKPPKPSHASILTMQNCCTDLLASGASEVRIRNRILEIFEKSAPGSLFILADVAERDIYTLFGDIADAASDLGDVLLSPEGNGERHSYSFEIPQSVKHYLFTTYKRSGNRFYPLMLRRTN